MPTRRTISQIYLIKYSTRFGQVHRPSSGVSQHCIHAIGQSFLFTNWCARELL